MSYVRLVLTLLNGAFFYLSVFCTVNPFVLSTAEGYTALASLFYYNINKFVEEAQEVAIKHCICIRERERESHMFLLVA